MARVKYHLGGFIQSFALALLFLTEAAISAPCEDINPNYRNGGGTKIGPFDFNDPEIKRGGHGSILQLVESEHFPEVVQTLKGGHTSSTPGGDLTYTLWVFPNHHRALVTLINYTVKFDTDQPPQMAYTAECYFKRAVQWRPDDAITRQVFGMYLFKKRKIPESIEQFLASVKLNSDNANSFYNLGLAYFENKNYEKALEAAHTAYALGFRLEGLKNKLIRAGKWRDPSISKENPLPAKTILPNSVGSAVK